MVGHGIGRKLHEAPEVPNYGRRGVGKKLEEGLVICIEPMVNAGTRNVYLHDDGWTLSTTDKKKSAHYELMVVVQKGKPDVLSTFDYIENNKS
jgi:methionyl aminopeptidase